MGLWAKEGWLESINRDPERGPRDFNLVGLGVAGDDTVGQLKSVPMCVNTDIPKHAGFRRKGREVLVVREVVHREGGGGSHGLWPAEQLPGQERRVASHKVRWSASEILADTGADAQEDLGELFRPSGGCQSGTESQLQGPGESLHHPI